MIRVILLNHQLSVKVIFKSFSRQELLLAINQSSSPSIMIVLVAPKVWGWDRHTSICQTEIIDLTGDTGARRSGCANSGFGFRTGWAAQEQCECESSKDYINCKGYGLSAIEVL